MAESLIQKIKRFQVQAKKGEEEIKKHKIKLFFSPTLQKKLYISQAIQETCRQLLGGFD